MMDESLYEQNPNNFTLVTDSEMEEYCSMRKNEREILIRSLHQHEREDADISV